MAQETHLDAPPEKQVKERLQLPDNLRGKKILEVFSGPDEASMRQPLEKRGADYFSIDMYAEINSGTHVRADAWKLPFRNNVFDFVVMSGPTLYWGRNLNIWDKLLSQTYLIRKEAFTGLAECIRVLSKESGSAVKVAEHMSLKDITRIRRNITNHVPDFNSNFIVEYQLTDEPLANDYGAHIPGKFSYALSIVRK